jgi:hypothetical protein
MSASSAAAVVRKASIPMLIPSAVSRPGPDSRESLTTFAVGTGLS